MRWQFDRAMARFAPFESQPHLAVAVSGGADSLALALLAQAWVTEKGGRITALIVDHGLRPESAGDARKAAAWLRSYHIAVKILHWHPAPNAGRGQGGIQAAARAARYQLLSDWCRAHHVLHLLTAHHRDDQLETFLIREGRSSGPTGLAGMSASRFWSHGRLLRPLLGVTKRSLEQYLHQKGQGWIEDPTNRDRKFLRVQMRERLGRMTRSERQALAARIRKLGRERAVQDVATAHFFARHAVMHPDGTLQFPATSFADLSLAQRARVLRQSLACIGGGDYPVSGTGLSHLSARLRAGLDKVATLGGCLILPYRGDIWICREWKTAPQAVLPAGAEIVWDERWLIRHAKNRDPVLVTALARLKRPWPVIRPPGTPEAIMWGKPVLLHGKTKKIIAMGREAGRFAPRHKLAPARFTVV